MTMEADAVWKWEEVHHDISPTRNYLQLPHMAAPDTEIHRITAYRVGNTIQVSCETCGVQMMYPLWGTAFLLPKGSQKPKEVQE